MGVLRSIWSAADNRQTWERRLFKASLVGTVLWLLIGTPASIMLTNYAPYGSTFMSTSLDPDWDPDPARQFAKRRAQNEDADKKNRDAFLSTLAWSLGFPFAYWAALATLFSFTDRYKIVPRSE